MRYFEIVTESIKDSIILVIDRILYDWVTSNLSDFEHRSNLLSQLLEIDIPSEYRTIPNSNLYQFGFPKTKYASFSYRETGARPY